MLALSLVIVIVLAAAVVPAPGPESTSSGDEVDAVRLTLVVMGAEDETPGLVDELSLRLPQRSITRRSSAVPLPSEPFALVRVSTEGRAQGRVQVTLSDGRAYYRSVELLEGQSTRTLAGAIANLIAAIEEDRVEPDATDVDVEREAEPEAEPEPAAEPRPESERVSTPPQTPPKPGWDVGAALDGQLGLSLGPPRPPSVVFGGGGQLGVLARSPKGGLLRLSLRATSGANAGTRLTRLRVGIGGGYGFRRGRFELLADAAATLEPLWVDTSTRRPGGGATSPAPLFGALVGVAPGVIVTPTDGSVRVRLFGRVEIAGSAEARGRPGVVRIVEDSGTSLDPVMRAGGLELSVGVGVGLWHALLPRKERRR